MSLKQKKSRSTSTAGKINRLWVRRLFMIFLFLDLIAMVLITTGFLYYAQVQEFGSFDLYNRIQIGSIQDEEQDSIYVIIHGQDREINLFKNRTNHETMYVVTKEDGSRVETDLSVVEHLLHMTSCVILALEGIVLLHNLLFGVFAIRRKLKPLDRLAQITNELGSQTEESSQEQFHFDETTVHHLEDAIAKITPDGPDGVLHTTDDDLKGLEIAINGLLDRMRMAYRQQTRFVSDASHELRTPIAVIQGYVNMLDRWGKEDEKVLNESIEAIKNESEHMKKLVDQLLFLARGDSGRNKFVLEQVNLNELVREVYEESLMIDEKHIYRYQIQDQAYYVYADSSMIKQAVRILADNAAKYTPEHEQIRIGCGFDENHNPMVYVQDNGIGMKGEDVTHVFERFYRVDEDRDSKTGGTGLGLSIAKWIVDRHGGFFKVLSYPEIGTRISIILPQQKVKMEWERRKQDVSGSQKQDQK